jgi:hypothetical protein
MDSLGEGNNKWPACSSLQITLWRNKKSQDAEEIIALLHDG